MSAVEEAEAHTAELTRDLTALERVEEALSQIELLPDEARATAERAMEAVVAVYAAGLGRLVTAVEAADPDLVVRLTDDELVAHLLLLHGLHPDSVEARVQHGLEDMRPWLKENDAQVELVGVEGDTAEVRVTGGGTGSAQEGLAQAVEDAVLTAAPELAGVDVICEPASTSTFIPLADVTGRAGASEPR